MARNNSNELRIIGGLHRGRKLHFPDAPGLRPTADRIRETLFNWLMPIIEGAHCLDLFSGSGALGFEALSRGAANVVMVEQSPRVIEQLRANLTLLEYEHSQVIQADCLSYLESTPDSFDIIFIDPPFKLDVLTDCIDILSQRDLCNAKAQIYLEAHRKLDLPTLPEQWHWHRNKKAGQVGYHLIHCD